MQQAFVMVHQLAFVTVHQQAFVTVHLLQESAVQSSWFNVFLFLYCISYTTVKQTSIFFYGLAVVASILFIGVSEPFLSFLVSSMVLLWLPPYFSLVSLSPFCHFLYLLWSCCGCLHTFHWCLWALSVISCIFYGLAVVASILFIGVSELFLSFLVSSMVLLWLPPYFSLVSLSPFCHFLYLLWSCCGCLHTFHWCLWALSVISCIFYGLAVVASILFIGVSELFLSFLVSSMVLLWLPPYFSLVSLSSFCHFLYLLWSCCGCLHTFHWCLWALSVISCIFYGLAVVASILFIGVSELFLSFLVSSMVLLWLPPYFSLVSLSSFCHFLYLLWSCCGCLHTFHWCLWALSVISCIFYGLAVVASILFIGVSEPFLSFLVSSMVLLWLPPYFSLVSLSSFCHFLYLLWSCCGCLHTFHWCLWALSVISCIFYGLAVVASILFIGVSEPFLSFLVSSMVLLWLPPYFSLVSLSSFCHFLYLLWSCCGCLHTFHWCLWALSVISCIYGLAVVASILSFLVYFFFYQVVYQADTSVCTLIKTLLFSLGDYPFFDDSVVVFLQLWVTLMP